VDAQNDLGRIARDDHEDSKDGDRDKQERQKEDEGPFE
jgi:hypothetical protein